MPESDRVSESGVGVTGMESWGFQNFGDCQLGDKRLNQRALEIGKALVVGFGQALSMLTNYYRIIRKVEDNHPEKART